MRERLRASVNKGLFTPPSLQGSVQIPGNSGGANWGLASVDPTKGTMYVVSKEQPALLTLRVLGASGAVQPVGASADPDVDPRGPTLGQMPPASNLPAGFVPYTAVAPYGNYRDLTMGAPPLGPPWSQITAYDLNKGTILWQVPNGDAPELAARGIKNTGSPTARSGGVVTAGGLFFIGTPDRKFRAYDQDTGKIVWEKEVGGPINGVPAVYEINGREYVAVCVGSAEGRGNTPNPTAASQYVVFALPGK